MSDYVYTVARLRGMENSLLQLPFFLRLLESATLDDAMKMLTETPYSQWLAKTDNVNFDTMVDAALLSSFTELSQFVPDIRLVSLFRMNYDYHNVKVLLKGLFKTRAGEPDARRHDLLSPLGTTPIQKVLAAMETDEYSNLPHGLGEIVLKCWSHWDQFHDARAVDLILDAHLFANLYKTAAALRMPQVLAWVRQRIDIENLRLLIRLRRMGYDTAAGLSFFHSNGNVPPADVARLLNEPVETWSKLLLHTDVGALLAIFQDKADLSTLMTDATQAFDEHLTHILGSARYSMDDPSNVILYILRKEIEARNLRVVLVCVSGGMDRDYARRLLSHA